jgi:uncharacterized membrane protein
MKTSVVEDDFPDVAVSNPPPEPSVESGEGVKVEKTVTINRPISEVYAFWRNLENLPLFMNHLESVSMIDEQTSHWVVKTNMDTLLEWDARIIENRANEMISWRSLPSADVHNAGSVWFIPATGNRGTVVKVAMKYAPPGGKLGAVVAKLLGDDPAKMISDDLHRLKSLLETGEIPTIEGQPKGNQK